MFSSTSASHVRTPPTGGSSLWPRSASSPWSATRTGRVTGLPHAERAVENCLEAIRRVRASRGAAGSKLDTNHVWVQVWPVVEAELDQITTLQGKITPLTDGAGIEEVLATGRVTDPTAPPPPSRSGSTPDPAPASRPPSRRRRPSGSSRSTSTPPTSPGPAAAAWSTPTSSTGVLAGPDGTLVEHDLDDTGALVPVERAPGLNKAGILVAW